MPVKPSGVETNLAGLVLRHGENTPEYPALIVPTRWNDDEVLDEVCLSYGELAERISRVRGGLARAGIGEGDRVVVMFGVRADLYILVLALLAAGVAVVLIDTGMGKERVLQAMKLARPKAIMSIDALLKHRLWLPALWGMRRYSIDRPRLGVRSFSELLQSEPLSGPALERAPGAPGLITFTSGTTGRPKGANRTHDLLIAQHEALKEHFPATADEIDMPCFPVVPLHNLCSGITTVMPAVDFRQPASVEPGVVVSQIRAHGVTRFAGAPAYMTRIANHLVETGQRLESVRSVGCGGAPTPRSLCAKLIEVFPDAQKEIIYGSTEAEPIASVTMDEFLEAEGPGYLVGRVAEAATVAIVEFIESSVPRDVSPGEVGELIVRGGHVLRGYVDDPEADRETKIPISDGGIWHRTGDAAKYDEEGRIWLVGRINDSLQINGQRVHPFPIEAELDMINGVSRSALIAHGRAPLGEVLLVVDDMADALATVENIRRRLNDLGHGALEVHIVSEMPMDARHNSKIDRHVLRTMREAQ